MKKCLKINGIDDDAIRNRYQRTDGPLGRNERAVDKFIKMLHQHEKSDDPNVRKIISNIDNLKDIAPNFTIFESEDKSFYMSFFRAITINVNSSDLVTSHEFGHALLGMLNNTEVPENYEQITKNARAHCVDENTKDKFIDYIVHISDSENQDRTEAQKGPVSDIISAVFQYPKLEFQKINKACVLPAYHNRDYYFDEEKGAMKTDKIFDECFANYYSLVANNCHKELEELRMLLGDEWMQTMETELERAAKTIEMVQEKHKPDAMEQIKSTILGVNESNVPDRIIEPEKQNEKTEDERRRVK